MTDMERRTYTVTGEATSEQWDSLLNSLGHVGIAAQLKAEAEHEAMPLPLVPATLLEFKSKEQYVAPQHAIEFLPLYRADPSLRVTKALAKYREAEEAIDELVETEPRRAYPSENRLTKKEQALYIHSLGLVVGKLSVANGKLIKPERTPTGRYINVVQADGFIDLMERILQLPRLHQPQIYARQMGFLRSLAKYIDSCITNH